MAPRPRNDPKKQAAIAAIRGAGGDRHLEGAAALAASRAGCTLAEIAAAMRCVEEDAATVLRSARRDERDNGVIVATAWGHR